LDKKTQIVLASSNAGKIRELKELFTPLDLELISQTELGVSDIEETGSTFIENALLKARHAAQQTGLPALADDSGLVVAALAGAPGIYSARYAGSPTNDQSNNEKLLLAMRDVPQEKRQAFFYCVLVFLTHADDPTPLVCDGKWSGSILFAPQGGFGFGYNPVFYVPTENASAAEIPSHKKNQLSHRGLALQSLLKLLPDKLNECAFRTKSY
jgi:XTP/dITP diphosphohydrolase